MPEIPNMKPVQSSSVAVPPDTYRILFVGQDRGGFEAIQKAFEQHQLYGSLCHQEEKSDSPESNLIDLVYVQEWSQAAQLIQEAQAEAQSFSLGVGDIGVENWDAAHTIIENLWKVDGSLNWVCCLPQDPELWPSDIVLSRPFQWMILRKPILEVELIQLVWMWAGNWLRQARWSSGDDSPENALPSSVMSESDNAFPDARETEVNLELAREELASSKTYVNNILRSMADSLFVITADMTIGAANPSLLELLGYEEEDLIGESPGCIFGEEFARGAIMEHLMLQGSVSGVESSFLTKDGRSIPITVSGSIMKDEYGQFQGMVCVAQDITERKRMEEEKQKLHEQLLDTSRQLGMAEVASDVLHNVGNVLNSINVSIGVIKDLLNRSMVVDVQRVSQLLDKHREDLGAFFTQHSKGTQVPSYLKKLSEQLLEEKRLALLEMDRLRENTEQAQHCVSAQLDLAKPKEITEPIVLAELVDEALMRHQDLVEKWQISVVREYQELPQLLIDKYQVLEVMADVIENACQAMESVNRRELILRVKQINGPPDSARVEIQDTGIGIPQEDLTRIFGQGFTTKEHGRGSSLHSGALIAKNLGGALNAESSGQGCGAVFFLDLPGNFHFPEI